MSAIRGGCVELGLVPFGVAGILQFLNPRKSAQSKGSVDAYVAWRTFTSGGFEDRDREHVRVVAKRDQLFVIRRLLVDLVQDVMKFAGRRVRPPTNSTRSKTDSMTCVVCEVTAPPGPPR